VLTGRPDLRSRASVEGAARVIVAVAAVAGGD